MQKTYNILKQQDSFFTKINLHIIQCDAEVQEHTKITSQKEFDEYLKTMKLRGFGGTDFRPVFLMGTPGIGKTAIIEQIAAEMGVGVLSYSMTHHTRQSASGLPFIVHKNYGGVAYDVSEYTMSEIISSVYDLMENTGVKW